MAQVKFYAKNSMPDSSSIDENGLYFIGSGELYKGAQRFGLGRVTTASTSEALAALEGVARGDINVGFQGAKIWDGQSKWLQLGDDTTALQSMWQSDISTWIAGLAAGGEGSIVTGIVQGADGKVTATAVAFPTLATGENAGEITLGSQSAKVSGWDALVSRVDGIETIVDVSNSTVSAATGQFDNLIVASTAAFSVTSISADSLTINGSSVEDIADDRIAKIAASTVSGTSNGITVGVTTSGGSVTAVSVDASTFGNVMHFKGVVDATPSTGDYVAGDIVIIGASATTGFVEGQEYICTGTDPLAWELIGDQNTYALNAYTSDAAVYSGVANVPGALNAVGAAVDTLTTSVSGLITKTNAYVGGTASSSANGVEVQVAIASATMAPTVSLAVDTSAIWSALGLGTAASKSFSDSVDASSADIPTCSAVADYVAAQLSWITE